MTQTQSSHPPVHPHHTELKNPDGSWRFTNALVDETSPYLLQHAHNPVDWHPWGKEAFELARREGKPIFLSIGYSTCYWCHVMERQVFENPALAAVLNERFVSIKVDREERPDVDDIYMAAVQMMTGHGGWPMSVFLTPPGAGGADDPGLKPFWAGTYIPPQPKHGMPGFGQVVEGLSQAWHERRDDVIRQSDQVADTIRRHLSQRHGGGRLGPEVIQETATQLVQEYDTEHGGFGSAPKFPQPAQLAFLMKAHQNNPNPDLWRALAYTLERMARGGMYDQIGGGFHRYSTDEKWLVPHFEKMLYDNAQLIEVYLTGHEIARDEDDPGLYSRVVRETCEYVLREMTPKDSTGKSHGAFWSAQDAEVNALEGGNYVWTADQIREAIKNSGADAGMPVDELADLAVRLYGLDRGTNFKDPHAPDVQPVNVVYLPERLDVLATGLDQPLSQIVDTRQRINQILLAARDRRPQPMTDDKVLTSWNGMMIAAMARAGRVLETQRYTDAAVAAADQVLSQMGDPNHPGRLFRTMRNGRAKTAGFLEDYAYFTHGLIELHRTTGEKRWLDEAVALSETATRLFSAKAEHGGGYYDTLPDQEDLFVRTVSTYDGAVPSGNSQMSHNQIDLYEITGDEAYLKSVAADLMAFSGALAQRGPAMVHMQHALLRVLEIDSGLLIQRHDGEGSPADNSSDPVNFVVSDDTIDVTAGPATFDITITIRDGYHINTAAGTEDDPPGESIVPTKLELVGAPGLILEVNYPPAVARRYPFAEDMLKVYEGTVVLEATIRVIDPAGLPQADNVALVLRYQACTDSTCLEPTTLKHTVNITGLPR